MINTINTNATKVTLANGTELNLNLNLQGWELAMLKNSTSTEADEAESAADNRAHYEEYIDPSNAAPFDETEHDDRVALALFVIAYNR